MSVSGSSVSVNGNGVDGRLFSGEDDDDDDSLEEPLELEELELLELPEELEGLLLLSLLDPVDEGLVGPLVDSESGVESMLEAGVGGGGNGPKIKESGDLGSRSMFLTGGVGALLESSM